MYMSLLISDSKGANLSVSRVVDSKEMFVKAWYSDNVVSMVLEEEQMRELRKHLTIQIRKLQNKKT